MPEECAIPECTDSVKTYPEPFVVPSDIDHRGGQKDVMCDQHHVAARIYAYTRSETAEGDRSRVIGDGRRQVFGLKWGNPAT